MELVNKNLKNIEDKEIKSAFEDHVLRLFTMLNHHLQNNLTRTEAIENEIRWSPLNTEQIKTIKSFLATTESSLDIQKKTQLKELIIKLEVKENRLVCRKESVEKPKTNTPKIKTNDLIEAAKQRVLLSTHKDTRITDLPGEEEEKEEKAEKLPAEEKAKKSILSMLNMHRSTTYLPGEEEKEKEKKEKKEKNDSKPTLLP